MEYFQQIIGKREIEHNPEGSAGAHTEPLRVPRGKKVENHWVIPWRLEIWGTSSSSTHNRYLDISCTREKLQHRQLLKPLHQIDTREWIKVAFFQGMDAYLADISEWINLKSTFWKRWTLWPDLDSNNGHLNVSNGRSGTVGQQYSQWRCGDWRIPRKWNFYEFPGKQENECGGYFSSQ